MILKFYKYSKFSNFTYKNTIIMTKFILKQKKLIYCKPENDKNKEKFKIDIKK
jgi:hypothetical protein